MLKLKALKSKALSENVEKFTKDQIYKTVARMGELVSVKTNISILNQIYNLKTSEFKEQFEIMEE